MQTHLIVNENGQTRRIECKEVVTIGRDEGNDVVLHDARVSRRHAMLYRTPDGSYYLVDEGSANGSCVNTARVTLPTRLNDGDQITIASVNLQFRQPAARTGIAEPARDERATTLILPQGVEVQRYAILVADIRGFTHLSESIPVRELTGIMNRWFRDATQCVTRHRGTIDKFLGDCVYARWPADNDPAAALLQALATACELEHITAGVNRNHPHLPQALTIGVGINVGNAALGTDQGRTAIGDAVNLTFRLQEQTRQQGHAILLNRDAYLNLPRDLWLGRETSLTVAGKTQPLSVLGLSFEEAESLLQAVGTPPPP